MKWLDGIPDSVDMSLVKVWDLVMDGEDRQCATVHGIQRIEHDWETELNWVVHKFYFFLVQSGRLNISKNLFSFRLSILLPYSVQFSSVPQSCPTICYLMNHSTPGLPVHHQLPEFTQTHAHRVSDAIQPPHPLSSPSPPAPNPSQHQGLFQ